MRPYKSAVRPTFGVKERSTNMPWKTPQVEEQRLLRSPHTSFERTSSINSPLEASIGRFRVQAENAWSATP